GRAAYSSHEYAVTSIRSSSEFSPRGVGGGRPASGRPTSAAGDRRRAADVGGGLQTGRMCGRYASFRDAQDLADAFAVAPPDVAEDARLLPPSWNVAPTDAVRVVVERAPKDAPQERAEAVRSLRLARWGLVPGWAKDPSVG